MEKLMNKLKENLNSIHGAGYELAIGSNTLRYFRSKNGSWNLVCIDYDRPGAIVRLSDASPDNVESMAEAMLKHGDAWPEIAKSVVNNA